MIEAYARQDVCNPAKLQPLADTEIT